MTEWSVVPAIRVPDMSAGIEFYVDRLGFRVERGGPNEGNVSLSFGQARMMLDSVPTEYYSPAYNEAINGRIGSASALALYIEAPNLDAYYARVGEQGVTVVDPIADRPWGQREFTIQDPQGNWLSFWEALPTDDEELALT